MSSLKMNECSLEQQQGFTLVELMIVVMIVAILAAIGYPSYTRYVQDTRQAEAQGEMMALSGALERYRAKNFSYEDANTKLSELSPVLANSDYFSTAISVTGTGSQQYEITTTPKTGLMTGTEVLKLNSEGQTCMKVSGCTIGTDDSWKEH
ncbi:type IV pilin protein [uncultured Alcanivorax sp.]|jgi:type IV pilus assembly protein PilE|uniref:type IV pilin protein n=1 Tax=uncultured Alcanivorax sp. TaxID=191215 RepID=UPI0030DD5F18